MKPDDHPFNKPVISAGEQVKVEWNGSWWDANVLNADNPGQYLITYIGFDSSWDEWVSDERIQKINQ